jgi:hypothetical protein
MSPVATRARLAKQLNQGYLPAIASVVAVATISTAAPATMATTSTAVSTAPATAAAALSLRSRFIDHKITPA